MIWERNDGRADSKNHRRMNLAVSVGIYLTLVFEVRNVHGDHCCLFFFDVDKLTETKFQCLIKIDRIMLSAKKSLDVFFLEDNLTVFYDEQWSLHSA